MRKGILLFILFGSLGFSQNNRIDILIQKEICQTHTIKSYSKQPISIPKDLMEKLSLNLSDNNFFKIIADKKPIGYYYVGKAFGKTDYFDFMVIFDNDLNIKKVKVLVYREERGGEVASNRWLKQFVGKNNNKQIIYQQDIAAISGATISAKSITGQINKLLEAIGILHTNKII